MKAYIQNYKDRFIEELFGLLRIPSVSAVARHREDMYTAARYVQQRLQEAGADATQLHETDGHPIVYGEKTVSRDAPTVLVYGHYDVQPPDPVELWRSPPFAPVLRDGKIFARGACDDKGQMYMHIKALEGLSQQGALSCNMKFLIEGEEEIGSPHLDGFVARNKKLLNADVAVISDTALASMEHPSITVGLRGLSYVEVALTGPNRDLHSGVYGGAVANPIHALCDVVHALIDREGRIAVPGFYDKVRTYSPAERARLGVVPFDEAAYSAELGIAVTQGEKGYTTPERIGIRPSLDVNGIWGGYTGEGAKTVLPSKAYAKISMRLVPDQDSGEVTEQLIRHIRSLAPPSVTVETRVHHGAEPVVVATDSAAYRTAEAAFEQVWGKKPLPTYDGGSIPVVSLFKKALAIETMLMGFGLQSDAIHAPNEHYGVKNFLLGIETLAAFYQKLPT